MRSLLILLVSCLPTCAEANWAVAPASATAGRCRIASHLTFPNPAFGDHPAGDGQTLTDPPQPHSVLATIAVERLQDGALRRDGILSHRFDLPEAEGSPITLSFG